MLTLIAVSSAVGAAAGNCSDPKEYPVNPITHESHPCDDFCSNKCDFTPSAPMEMTMIRMTPRNVSGIANKDTGDDQGDLFFTVLSATKASECAKPKPAPWAGCFLNGDNIFIKNQVSVDGKWGFYQECNPTTHQLPEAETNIGNFACCDELNCAGSGSLIPTPKAHNSSKYCFCDRTNKTVGKTLVTDHFGKTSPYMPSYLSNTAKLIGGTWYSTPAAGECKDNQTPGDSSGCTWKVSKVITVVNQTCVKGNVYGAIEKNCPAAFEACAVPYNRSDACYSEVFFQAFLGNTTFGCKPMTRNQLLAPWTHSFEGGCPPVDLDL